MIKPRHTAAIHHADRSFPHCKQRDSEQGVMEPQARHIVCDRYPGTWTCTAPLLYRRKMVNTETKAKRTPRQILVTSIKRHLPNVMDHKMQPLKPERQHEKTCRPLVRQ